MRTAVMLAAIALGAMGCASTTPTREVRSSYAIYEITPVEGVSASKIGDAIRTALQKNMSEVRIATGIPPSPLPEKPGRFQLVDPFKGSPMAALAARSGQSFQLHMCEGSILTATAQDQSMADHGEGTSFFLCLLPYQAGYHIDIYTTFAKQSGGFSPAALGAALARSVVGDSSQFLPRTIKAVTDGVEQTGASVRLVEQYP